MKKRKKEDQAKGMRGKKDKLLICLVPMAMESDGWMAAHKPG